MTYLLYYIWELTGSIKESTKLALSFIEPNHYKLILINSTLTPGTYVEKLHLMRT
jgi:hypothetical protein